MIRRYGALAIALVCLALVAPTAVATLSRVAPQANPKDLPVPVAASGTNGFAGKIKDGNNDWQTLLNCNRATASVRLDIKSLDAAQGTLSLGAMTSSSWFGCIATPLDTHTVLTHVGNWEMTSRGSFAGGGVASVDISNIVLRGRDDENDSRECRFKIVGTARAQIQLDTKRIVLKPENSNLTATNVSGCSIYLWDDAVVGMSGAFSVP